MDDNDQLVRIRVDMNTIVNHHIRIGHRFGSHVVLRARLIGGAANWRLLASTIPIVGPVLLWLGTMELAGIDSSINVVLEGMEEQPHFKEAILDEGGELDSDLIESETVAAARGLKEKYPDLGAIVLECTNMVPYADDIRRLTGLPVYSIYTLATWFQAGLLPRRFPLQLDDSRQTYPT